MEKGLGKKMTLNEVNNLANNGDLKAMQALGEYYLNNDMYTEAWSWFSKAADAGYTQSIISAAYAGIMVGEANLKGTGKIDEAVKVYKKTLKYSYCLMQEKDVPQNTKNNIAKEIPTILFKLGYCLYLNEMIDEAIQYLTKPEAKTNPDCRVVLGICYFEKAGITGSFSLIKDALPLLKEVDHASLSEHEDVKYMAYMKLSLIYRLADELKLPGIKKDMDLSYAYCLKATQCGDGWGKKAQEELRKYKKRLFGGYTYIE